MRTFCLVCTQIVSILVDCHFVLPLKLQVIMKAALPAIITFLTTSRIASRIASVAVGSCGLHSLFNGGLHNNRTRSKYNRRANSSTFGRAGQPRLSLAGPACLPEHDTSDQEQAETNGIIFLSFAVPVNPSNIHQLAARCF